MKTGTAWLERWRGRIKALVNDEKKRVNLVVCLGLAGLVLLALPEWLPQEDASTRVEAEVSAPGRRTTRYNCRNTWNSSLRRWTVPVRQGSW